MIVGIISALLVSNLCLWIAIGWLLRARTRDMAYIGRWMKNTDIETLLTIIDEMGAIKRRQVNISNRLAGQPNNDLAALEAIGRKMASGNPAVDHRADGGKILPFAEHIGDDRQPVNSGDIGHAGGKPIERKLKRGA